MNRLKGLNQLFQNLTDEVIEFLSICGENVQKTNNIYCLYDKKIKEIFNSENDFFKFWNIEKENLYKEIYSIKLKIDELNNNALVSDSELENLKYHISYFDVFCLQLSEMYREKR